MMLLTRDVVMLCKNR